MFLPVGPRHQKADVLANDLSRRVAKSALRRRVDGLDDAALVDGNNAFHGGVDNGAHLFLAVPQGLFGLLVAGDFQLQRFVGFGQGRGALLHPQLQFAPGAAQRILALAPPGIFAPQKNNDGPQ